MPAPSFPLARNHFDGERQLSDGSLADLMNDLDGRIVEYSQAIVTPSRITGPPGQLPPIDADGALVYVKYDGAAGAQQVHRTIKIRESYVSGGMFHIHWTKSDDSDRSGEKVKWKISYKVFNGRDEDAALSPTVLTVEDTYDDDGTTTRVVHRTVNVPVGSQLPLVADAYLAVKVEKDTASASVMSEPGLVTLDLSYFHTINREEAP